MLTQVTSKSLCTRTRWRLALLFLCAALAKAVFAAPCDGSPRTQLSIAVENMPRIPRHDQPFGQSNITLRERADQHQLAKQRYDGRWFCIAYLPNQQRYLLGGVFERGAWLVLGSILYLHEDGRVEASAFDRGDYVGLTLTVSPSGRNLAFIGGTGSANTLLVLDTQQNRITPLGHAPSPPPTDDSMLAICKGEKFDWGSCWADGFTELDPGIIQFTTDSLLTVSYGHDSARKRAHRRKVRHFKLAE